MGRVNQGFSLIEIIMYSGLLSMLTLGIIIPLYNMRDVLVLFKNESRHRDEAYLVMRLIENEISLEDLVTPTKGQQMNEIQTHDTRIFLNQHQLWIQLGSQSPQPFTSKGLIIQDFGATRDWSGQIITIHLKIHNNDFVLTRNTLQ